MSRTGDDVRDEIFVLCIKVNHADAPSALFTIFFGVGAFDVASFGKNKHRVRVGNKVFFGEFFGAVLHHSRAAVVAILLANLLELLFDDSEYLLGASQNGLEFRDKRLHFIQLILDLLALEARELLEPHIEDSLRLYLGELERVSKARARLVN